MVAVKSKMVNLKKRQARNGLLFISPFIVGFIFFFLQPLAISLVMSFSEVSIGGIAGYTLKFIGFSNFIEAFIKDPNFLVNLTSSLRDIGTQTPVILVFSIFVAVIINQKFKGRVFARAVFFLPVVVTSGIIIALLKEDVFSQAVRGGSAQTSYVFQSTGIKEILQSMSVSSDIVSFFMGIVNTIFDMMWKSGVQVLLFLAALQGISPSLYEAAKVEGASGWEMFWKITLPIISPIIIVNIVYTIVDMFSDYGNPIMQMIKQAAFKDIRYGYSCSLAWVYFTVIFLLIGIVNLVMKRLTVYQVK